MGFKRVLQGNAMCLDIVFTNNSFMGPVEYVLSSHQSLLRCFCKNKKKFGYCDASEIQLRRHHKCG